MAKVQRTAMGLLLLALCLGLCSVVQASAPRPAASSQCPPLPWPPDNIIEVGDEATLRYLAYHAADGTTLRLAPGVYRMTSYLHVNHSIAVRGATGRREDVVLDFGGMVGGYFGVLVDADDVTIADLTIRNCSDHCVSVQGHDRPVLHNLHLIDAYDQLVKVNPRTDGGLGSEDGLLACSLIEYTTTCPNEYTNGISAHDAHRWTVRNNTWRNIRTPGNTPCPVVLFWSGSTDTIVERNLLIDCFSGIAFGNASHGGIDHTGGIVRNNIIASRLPHDVAIEMVHAQGFLVAHNTAWLVNPYGGLSWGMEARYGESDGRFINNLTNMPLWLDRDGAHASGAGNLTNAQASWFVDAANADLHLRANASQAIDRVTAPLEVIDDWDGDLRPQGALVDVGADEVVSAEPTPTATSTRSSTPVAQVRLPLILR